MLKMFFILKILSAISMSGCPEFIPFCLSVLLSLSSVKSFSLFEIRDFDSIF